MSKKLVNPTVVLDNYHAKMLNGGWELALQIQTTNGNALQVTVTQPVDQACVQTILLYNTNLEALREFGREICQLASELIEQRD